jgi:hypothetical protein
MDEDCRDTGIAALVLIAAACLTLYFLDIAPPTGALVQFLFSRV